MKSISLFAAASAAILLAGCLSPLSESTEQQLRDSMMQSHQQFLQAVSDGQVELQRRESEVEKDLREQTDSSSGKNRIQQLDESSGPNAFDDVKPTLGANLEGQPETKTVSLTLEQAVALAVANNVDLLGARMIPGIRKAQVDQAAARFDMTFFTNFDFTRNETPRPPTTIAAFGSTQGERYALETGIRKSLVTGGAVSLAATLNSTSETPSLATLNPYWDGSLALTVNQPLARGFGEDVNKAEIQLTQSARRQSVEDLRSALIETVNSVERAYWALVQRRHVLQVRQDLLDKTTAERKRLRERRKFDVEPATYTEVAAREELRRLEVVQAQRDVRQASDLLKRLINAPHLPLADETVIVPADDPPDMPLAFSLLDSVTVALRNRPEMRSALLRINDASIRQRVADNARLPVLDLTATVRFNGVGNTPDNAYEQVFDASFVDYIVGLNLELPIGNRGPEALYAQRILERQQAVTLYQQNAQDVVLEVKDALREIVTANELIAVTRASRRAAAESLRSINVKEDAGADLTPDFIDIKLRRQEALANAQEQEIAALVNYNIAISRLYAAMGTLLERNQIDFKPDAD